MRAAGRVAIIGGGVSGLAAANLLAARGVAVRLFEASGKLGGCCATTRCGGYTFNDGAIHLAMPGMLDHLFGTLGLDRQRLLPLRRIQAIQSTTLPDGTIVDLHSGSKVDVVSPNGSAASALGQAQVDAFLQAWEPLLHLFADDVLLRPFSLPHLVARGWRHLGRLRGTAGSHLRRHFSSPALRAALGATMLFAGAPADRLPAAALLGLVAMLREGCCVPEGGMGRIPDVLGEALRARGGGISLGAAVTRIVVRNGRVRAVELEDGSEAEVDVVLSTVSAMQTIGSLLSAPYVPARSLRKLRRTPLSASGFVLQLGLDGTIQARAHLNGRMPWLDEQAQVFEPGGRGMRWSTYSVPTATLAHLAPPGCSIVEMFVAIGQGSSPDEWTRPRQEEVAQQAIELLRRDHPFGVNASRIVSPREFRDGLRLYEGALYGVAPAAGPRALFAHRTPIHGLFQGGQTTWPGFGVPGAGLSGVLAAESLLRHALR